MKKNFKIKREDFQSGGTDLTDSMKMLSKQRCDLAIVITDGYFDKPNVDLKKLPEMVFIISGGGQVNHPMNKCGKSVKYKK
jgi:predicted metal-dependent peptidase